MKERIIVMGGSYNPPTIAHLRLLLGAVNELGADKGIFVPASHTYVCIKMRRAKQRKEVLKDDIRLEMLQAMAAEDPRLLVDDCDLQLAEKGYTYESMEMIQEKYPDAELFFLAGGDKVSAISRWHRVREFLDRFQVIQTPEGLEGISSSAVREMLRDGTDGAQTMLHPKVWEILQKSKGE